jgi:hypothetical protein
MVPLPAPLLADLAGRDEVLVTSRAGAGMGTVRMSFAIAPPGVVYLLTSAFSRKASRWDRDPWVRLTAPGSRLAAEAVVQRVMADGLDPDAEAAVLACFPAAGAATPEALRELLETGTHLLFRVEGGPTMAGMTEGTGTPHPGGIAERLASVRRRITAAAEGAGRDPASVRLIAVTKTVPPERIAEAVAAGVTEIGENRVQEARLKHAAVPSGLRWHLLGHLQSNKAALAAQLFDTVHSLDSERLALALGSHRDPARDPISALVEVDFTGIAARSGIPAEAAVPLLRAVAGQPGLRLAGLMTIAPFGEPAAARQCFRSLRELRDRLQSELGLELAELSMGMSDDFEAAIAEGATMVRLGRVLFGERGPAGIEPAG